MTPVLPGFRRLAHSPQPPLSLGERFGVRSLGQLSADFHELGRDGVRGVRFQFNWRSAALLRPGLSLPAYAGFMPDDGLAPVFNLFDRTGGGRRFTTRVSRTTCRDFRGGRLTYDEHDGTDLVCPPGTPLCAAAPGVAVMIRDRWLRGGLTVAVDHGWGIVTQYTHCSRALVELGEHVQRNQPVALSGTSGIDMTQFFPWVPPHIHFMVYVDGRPVDPFLARGESPRPGTWMSGNRPQPARPLADDPTEVSASAIDDAALERAATACTDSRIQAEIARVADRRVALAALLDDALCHDRWAFADAPQLVRPAGPATARPVRLSLPLPYGDYRGVRLADTRYSRPPA